MRTTLLLVALSLAMTIATPALADADLSRAEELFVQGRAALKVGDFARAIPLFEESERLDPGAGTLLNLAACHAELGRTATAYRLFGEALYAAERSGDGEQAEVARERRESLAPRLSSVRIVTATKTAEAATPSVEIDGVPIALSVLDNRSLVHVDPGLHRVVARSSTSHKEWEHSFSVDADPPRVTTIDVPPLDVSTATTTTTTEKPTTTRWPPLRVTGAATLSLGVLSLGIATYFTLRALDLRSESDRECPDGRCTASGVELNDHARANGDRATGFFIAGLTGAAVGALLYLTGSPSARATKAVAHGGLLVW